MSKISLNYNDKDYTLEYNRQSVRMRTDFRKTRYHDSDDVSGRVY